MRALAFLAAGLDSFLRESRHYDAAYILEYAIRQAAPVRSDVVAAVLDETPMSRRMLRYLHQSFGDRLIRIGRQDYGVSIPDTVAGSLLDPVLGAADGVVSPGGMLRHRQIDEHEKGSVQVFGSRGPEAEVGDVIRYCLEHRIPLDDVELAYSNASIYVPQLVDLADRFQLDVSFAEGVPAILTRPGAGLKGFLEWITGNCSAAHLAAMMSAGILSFHRAVDEVKWIDMPALTGHLRLAVLDEGIERYVPAVERLAVSRDGYLSMTYEGAESQHGRRSRLLLQCVQAIGGAVPAGAAMTVPQISSLCLRFLEDFAVVHGERDERARESLRDRFDQFGKEGTTVLPKRLALQMAADMVERHTVQASTAGAGSLHAVSIERAGYTERGHVFVVGLDVDNFPGRSAEDPILLDVERRQLSVNLDLKSPQATDRIWHLIRAGGMAHGHVYFGTSVFNAEREEAVVYPSPFFQSVAKQLEVDYLHPPPLSQAPFPLDDTDVLLPQRRRSDYREVVGSHFPWMEVGTAAARARKAPRFSEYDGWLDAPDGAMGYSDEGVVFSANRMEKLAACPYRYFLHYVLGIRKPDYYVADPTRWLAPRDFGTLLHDLYHTFLKEIVEAGDRPDVVAHRHHMLSLLHDLIDRYKGVFPPDNRAAFEYEKQRLEESAIAFLETEASQQGTRPALFEFVFGGDDAQSEELARPVQIRLGGDLTFYLRGRIDRVDVLPDGSLAIWDYKTGSSYAFDQGSLLNGGLNLQWVLYAYAMEELASQLGLSSVVTRSGYYFASDRENGRQIAERPPERTVMHDVLDPLFGLARQGAFLHVTKKENECRFCDFRPICGTEAKTRRDLTDIWIANADLGCIGA
ncbi:MAG TPA: PD-(D/E)XK nuclease family protein, partial [Rhodothermales bacterium]